MRIRQLLFGVVVAFTVAWSSVSWGQGVNRPITRGQADGFYVNIDGDAMTGLLEVPALKLSGDFETTTGIFNSTVADGVVGLIINIVNPHTGSNLFEIQEAGGSGQFILNHAGRAFFAQALFPRNSIANDTASSGCNVSSGRLCNLDNLDINGDIIDSRLDSPVTFADVDGLLLSAVTTGNNAITFTNDGARLDLGTGALDYLTSDGTGTVVGGKLTVTNGILANAQILNSTSTSGCATSGGEVCNNDNFKVDGYVAIQETTEPTEVTGYTTLWVDSLGVVHAKDEGGTDRELLTGGSATAQMHQTRNITAFVINAQDDIHAYHSGTTPLVGTQLNGWTFDGGGEGTPHTIDSIAQNGSDITATTATSHTLTTGAIVSITNTGDVNYDKIHVVTAVGSATTFDVTAAFGSTATGTLDEAATLIAGAGAAGSYTVTWWCSASAASANNTFDLSVYKEAELVVGTEMRRKFSSTDFGVTSGGGGMTIADGDHISLTVANVGASGNIVRRNVTLLLEKN